LSSEAHVVGIDQSVQPITHTEGLQNYLARVRSACIEARDANGPCFEAVKQAIYNNTAVELTSEELGHFRRGCFDFLSELAHLDVDSILVDVSAKVTHELGLPASSPVESCCKLVSEVAILVRDVMSEACTS